LAHPNRAATKDRGYAILGGRRNLVRDHHDAGGVAGNFDAVAGGVFHAVADYQNLAAVDLDPHGVFAAGRQRLNDVAICDDTTDPSRTGGAIRQSLLPAVDVQIVLKRHADDGNIRPDKIDRVRIGDRAWRIVFLISAAKNTHVIGRRTDTNHGP